MSQKTFLLLLLLPILLVACTLPSDLPTPTAVVPTDTPSPTETQEPTATATQEPTATDAPTATQEPTTAPTPDVDPFEGQPNLFANPGFENPARPVIFGEVFVSYEWWPVYCDAPYLPLPCRAERRDTQSPARPGFNEPNLLMGRPEYRPTNVENRVHAGSQAQQWFCFGRTCFAGVYQRVAVRAGDTCKASIYFQSWSAFEPFGTDGQLYTSATATDDDRANSTAYVFVDQSGSGLNLFDPSVERSRAFTYADGHYDRYAQIDYIFTAESEEIVVAFMNLRLWPFLHNDSYVDDASLQCYTPGD